MNHTLFRGMALACLASVIPAAVEAQDFSSSGPINCVITRPRPVYTTHLCPQKVTTFCDVTETQVCHRQVVENVPITTCKDVTVDEGGYQMVWVSKPVTRQVAQTVVQQQVKTVAVPYQVRRRIPQTSTQMVPVQSVQYVNETVPIQMTPFAGSCSTCGGNQSMGLPLLAPQYGASTQPYRPMPNPAPYSSQTIPTMPAIDLPFYPNSGNSMPRTEDGIRVPGSVEETVRARGVPAPQEDEIPLPKKTSKFSGAPSAASVWKRQESVYAR